MNLVRVLGIVVILVIFFGIIIWSNIRVQRESHQAILLRILTNYTQIITSAVSFNLTYPEMLMVYFRIVKAVGESAKLFLSMDCLLIDSGIA